MRKTDEKMIVKGKRLDGRKPDELRKITMEVGVIPNANGSAKVSFGESTAIASVYGPRKLFPRHLQKSDTGIIQFKYDMATFSVEDRKRPGPSRREIEISKVARLALEPALFLKNYPKTTVDVFVEIIEADGSTRVTAINAASLALADAGVPMRDLVVGLSGGKVDDTLIIDLNGKEDNCSDADVPMAFLPNKNEITLLQMDGRLTPKETKEIIGNILHAGKEVYKKQVEALKKKYSE
ncbi:MAG: exosome complex exonuclease Rrp41 [Candidatus Aenigmarchaeota archaeon]|nr:exosome complex exonuclease Rrp41 [Candidatus Aenigmarchaeota archaeon]